MTNSQNQKFEYLPLTHGQRAFWFMYQMDIEGAAYNMHYAWDVRSDFDVDVFRNVLEKMTERHPMWRSTFVLVDGEPMQRVHETMDPLFEVMDVSDWDDDQFEEKLEAQIYRPFYLETEPPVRWRLFTRKGHDPVLSLQLQHLGCDVWTVMRAINEIRTLYIALSEGKEAELPPLQFTNHNVVDEQIEFLDSPEGKKSLDFWLDHLKGELPTLNIHTDKQRPPVASYRTKYHRFPIPQETADALKALCKDLNVSPFALYLSAYQILLHRYTRQNDIIVGFPTAGREEKFAELLGYFVSPVVIRRLFQGSPTFAQFAKDTYQNALDVINHQNYPFSLIVNELNAPRDQSRSVLYQTTFFWENPNRFENRSDHLVTMNENGLEEWGMGPMTWERRPLKLQLDQFDVTIKMVKLKDSYYAHFDWNEDLMEHESMVRMSEHYLTLLKDIAENPNMPISQLEIYSQSAREQVLEGWNATDVAYPNEKCAHQLFEEQVEIHPDSPAVGYLDQRLTYSELNQQANRIAYVLRQKGIKPDDLIGLYVEPSLETMVAILGIIKAGAGYAPLDPGYPRDRLNYILETAQSPLLVTTKALQKFKPDYDCEVFCIDEDFGDLPPEADQNPVNRTDPTNLCYVIFTSGSTGKPKGVQITHRNLVNLMDTMRRAPGLTPQDTLLSVTSLSFDLVVPDLYLPITSGGCTVFVSREEATDGQILLKRLTQAEATVMQGTPSTWRLLLDARWEGGNRLKVICGGEPFPPELVQQLLDRGSSVWNMYGPTETCVWSTGYQLTTSKETVSIGGPLGNQQVYIVDSNLNPTPVGVPGELCIAGDGVSRGYFKRPDLTVNVFVPNPVSGVKGDRMYRTGDLARYMPDGRIEHLGRIDHQVKVRGFRIELGEIESTLLTHHNVAQTVVMAREDTPGDQRLAAYIVPHDPNAVDFKELRAHIGDSLPEYMVPSAYHAMDAFPLSPNGKVDRKKLPVPDSGRVLSSEYVMPQNEAEQIIAGVWQELLNVDQVGVNDNFFELGGHSLLAIKVRSKLEELFKRKITNTEMFQYPTVSMLAQFLAPQEQDQVGVVGRKRGESITGDIAVVGLHTRAPGAPNVDQLWENLRDGVESVRTLTMEEMRTAGVPEDLISDPDYVPKAGFLDDYDKFDARFFGYSPREAANMDPQQRLLLEGVWSALEHSGYDPDQYDGRIGMYAGANLSYYLLNNLSTNADYPIKTSRLEMGGNMPDLLCTRISYKLNLKGPGITVLTACSTGLTAIHQAAQSLRGNECDMAVAGGVSIIIPQEQGFLYAEGGIFSPDGQCRPFAENSNGTLFGSGVALVVLKRLEDAVASGDTIHAILKGSALNNDGSLKVGLTAPSVDGQAECIADAIADAGVDPETITYVETHGTATNMGDPIEVAGLTKAFGSKKTGFCGLGSIKSNMGHLESAAGAIGLVKAVLALRQKQIPASLHFEKPNTNIDFDSTPFYVVSKLTDWKTDGFPRRAGVSSFGIGGTNAHVVLEEPPMQEHSTHTRPWLLLPWSAKTETAADAMTADMSHFLRRHMDINLADAAWTLKVGRRRFEHGRVLTVRHHGDAIETLDDAETKRIIKTKEKPDKRSVIFMFSGQGSQYVNMAYDLYQHEPVFRTIVDECNEILKPHLDIELLDLLYPNRASGEPLTDDQRKAASDIINQTRYSQPTLFVIEYATAKLWMSWGVEPEAMIGHSIGEYPAATLAGVMSLEDALRLVAERGRLMQSQPPGDMMAVPLPEKEIEPYLVPGVSVATINAPTRCVVAGPAEAVAEMAGKLKAEGKSCSILHTSHAFHSEMMDDILQPFIDTFKGISLNPPKIPYVSNLTGTWITDEEATDPEYYAKHLRNAVRFAEGIEVLLAKEKRALIEVGPGRTLNIFAKAQIAKGSGHVSYISVRHPKHKQDDLSYLLDTLGQFHLNGGTVDWSAYYKDEQRHRTPMPTYPFEKTRHWVEPTKRAADPAEKGPLFKRIDMESWFYRPTWNQTSGLSLDSGALAEDTGSWLVFADDRGLADAIIERLNKLEKKVIVVRTGSAFAGDARTEFTMQPDNPEHYTNLVKKLKRETQFPRYILHMWTVSNDRHLFHTEHYADLCSRHGFYSLMFLASALDSGEVLDSLHLTAVSNNMHTLTGEESSAPEKATLLGTVKVIGKEYPHILCRSVDVTLPANDRLAQSLVDSLIAEAVLRSTETVVAHRGRNRWLQDFSAAPLQAEPQGSGMLRDGGVYLITGGLGGIGLTLAQSLNNWAKAKLILTRRSEFPARDDWDSWLASNNNNDRTSRAIKAIRELEENGSEVMVAKADVSNREDMENLFAAARERFGAVHGVFHAAGAMRNTLINEKTKDSAASILAPKVRGALILKDILDQIRPDFLVLFSSTSAILGNSGMVDYCAANVFLDAFAATQSIDAPYYTVAINWDAWKDVGMAAEATKTDDKLLSNALTPDEGMEALRRILNQKAHSQVAVSTLDLNSMLRDIERFMASNLESEGAEAIEDMAGAEGDDQTLLTLKALWKDALGVDDVALDDNFYDLGGDSLLATSLAKNIRKAFGIKLSPNIFNDHPTLEGMVKHIDGLLGNERPAKRAAASKGNSAAGGVTGALAKQWCEALGMDTINPDDNFYDLGGDSLLATSLARSIRKALGLKLSPNAFNDYPTIALMAAHIEGETKQQEPELEAVQAPVETEAPKQTESPDPQPDLPTPAKPTYASETEQKVAELWDEVLGIADPDAPFRLAGGDISKGLSLASRIQDLFHLNVLPNIGETTTLTSLVAEIDTILWLTQANYQDETSQNEEVFEL